jgi:hypothetical protein
MCVCSLSLLLLVYSIQLTVLTIPIEESDDEELNIEYVEDLDEEDEEDLEQDMEGEALCCVL